MHISLGEFNDKLRDAARLVRVGSCYRHYKKDNLYKVLHLAISESTEEPAVVYQALYGDNLIWVRSLSDFTAIVEKDGKTLQRFEEAK